MALSKEWNRGNFLISTSQDLLQLGVIDSALASDIVYWAGAMSEAGLRKMLSNSLCFGVYYAPEAPLELADRKNPTQIGLARLITDEVTFAYLTDIFILEDYQGQGLGTWLIECVNEIVDSWPELRRALLITSGKRASEFYKKALGMEPFPQDSSGFQILSKKGGGSLPEA